MQTPQPFVRVSILLPTLVRHEALCSGSPIGGIHNRLSSRRALKRRGDPRMCRLESVGRSMSVGLGAAAGGGEITVAK